MYSLFTLASRVQERALVVVKIHVVFIFIIACITFQRRECWASRVVRRWLDSQIQVYSLGTNSSLTIKRLFLVFKEKAVWLSSQPK